MITLFRKIRRSLVATGAARKYAVYAIGEVLLVMVGILLALQVNNWNVDRNTKQFERQLLTELKNSLMADYFRVQRTLQGNRRAQASCRIILKNLNQNLPYHDSLDHHFGYANTWWKVSFRNGAFDNAKTHGLHFIQNDSTRILLTDLYENQMLFMESLEQRQILYYYNIVVPLQTELFETANYMIFQTGPGHKPWDYDSLKKNRKYRNVLKTNIENREGENTWLQFFILAKMKEVESRIQEEIDSR